MGYKNSAVGLLATMSEQKAYGRIAEAIAKQYAGPKAGPLEDLMQEAHLALAEALHAIAGKKEKPKEEKAYVRYCIHSHLKNYLQANSFDEGMISLDEQIGEDEDGDPVTRLDFIGVEPTQEESVAKEEKRAQQAKVASNRVEALQREGALKKSSTRIADIVRLKATGLTDQQIADILGGSRVSITKARLKLRKKAAA